ncbi:DUF5642 family protein [Mycolicibacterium thermoresistibile]
MRLWAAGAVAVFWLAACGESTEPSESAAVDEPSGPVVIDPPRINRARAHLPPEYEAAALPLPATAASLWGFGPGWAADPAQCATLADDGGDEALGWSASGAGGIVYAMAAPADPPDPGLVDQCGQWTVTAGNTDATVIAVDAPDVADAVTTGMVTTARTVVEGGTSTTSRADTMSAYLGGHVVVIAVVTDPGLPDPPLEPDFAATLLTHTVSELRG